MPSSTFYRSCECLPALFPPRAIDARGRSPRFPTATELSRNLFAASSHQRRPLTPASPLRRPTDSKTFKKPRRPFEKERLDAMSSRPSASSVSANKRELWRVQFALNKLAQRRPRAPHPRREGPQAHLRGRGHHAPHVPLRPPGTSSTPGRRAVVFDTRRELARSLASRGVRDVARGHARLRLSLGSLRTEKKSPSPQSFLSSTIALAADDSPPFPSALSTGSRPRTSSITSSRSPPMTFLERRLQTLVFKLGLAKSVHHARVLIRQRHIRVGKQIVNVPSFLVRTDSPKAHRLRPQLAPRRRPPGPRQAQEAWRRPGGVAATMTPRRRTNNPIRRR